MKKIFPKILNVFLFSVLLFVCGCNEKATSTQKTNIHTVKTLDILKNEINNLNENSLVIFDVDETLITPVDNFFHMKSWWQKFLFCLDYVWLTWDFRFDEKFIWYYNYALFNCKWRLVGEETPQLIKDLQRKGVTVVALTGCITGEHGNIPVVEDWRINQLKKFGIDFSSAFPKNNYFVLDEKFESPFPVFKDGIIFANICPKTASRTKAPVLIEFLEKINFKPNKIIFVDDGLKYLEETADEMKRLDIPFIGLHYIDADKFLTDVDMKVARKQLRNLIHNRKWLDDETFNLCQ